MTPHAFHLATMTFWEMWLYAYNKQALEMLDLFQAYEAAP